MSTSTTTAPLPPSAVAACPGPPRRVLLVTGSLGEGHHAAARAVEERARALWPGVEVVWTETLDAMGPAAGSLFPAIYAGCVRRLPWLYELYFRLLWRVPPFRAGTRAVVARWSARGIATAVAAHEPDLVVATFPEAVLGLGRLRRTGHLTVPVAALVADPAPHPLWGDKALDLHLVSTPEGARMLRRAVPGAAVRVGALPVAGAFTPPADDVPARTRPLVYVSCGSLAFGDVAGACAAVLDGGGDVLVSAGRVPSVRTRLERLAGHHPRGVRMRVVDWVSDPATTTRDCDAVVTNAGGATALEALACARPLLLFAPIPGHGRANAELLEREGLATVCPGTGGDHATWDDALTAFFADPVDAERTGWQILIARHTGGEGIGVLAKVHHSLGDGLAVTDALIRLFTDEEAALPARGPGDTGGPPTTRDRVRAAARIVRGVAGLATAGTAGRSPLTGTVGGPGHHRIGVRLDGKQVRDAARSHGVGTTALVLAVVAEFLHRHLEAHAPGGAPERVRTMVPLTTRTARGVGSRSAGNRTAAVSLDLPTGPMTPAARVARVAELLERGTTSGQPEGAAAVLRLLGLLPGRAQRLLVGGVYGRRFFHLLASVMPGARRPLHMQGALIAEVYPVLPLAEGVGLAVGALNWGRWTTLGVSVDAGIVRDIGGIPDCLRASLRDMSEACGRG